MDLTIEGKAYINGSFEQCCIGINKGKIASIKKTLKGDNHLNVGKKLILPAGIDIHVHFRDPGFTYKEDFSTGSKAAVFGGITSVYDMPNTNPPTTTVKSLLNKIINANQKSYADFGTYAGITENNSTHIPELAKQCNGFKIFLGSSTNSLLTKEQHLLELIKQIKKTNKIALFHAENENCLKKHSQIENTIKDHMNYRPSKCEEIAIKSVLENTNETSSKHHICHLSSCEGFELLRNKPANMSVGVTPHHLLFDVDTITSNHGLFKVNPPIRSHFDRETLWYGITSGLIDVLESDHAPHTFEEKQTDFREAPSGIVGVETMYPLFLAEVKNDHLPFQRLISLLCERPAEIMNIPKGKIEVGRDADIIIVDYKETTAVTSENLHSKCNWTPYEGRQAIFPSDVFLRGEHVIEENQLVCSPGIGQKIE